MAFNWEQLLRRYRVEYVTSGPNVAKGFIAVKCPFCGQSDPSEHMSIDLRGRFWRCWRNPGQHSGASRVRLIKALIRCTEEEARRLAGEDITPAPANDELADSLSKLRQSVYSEAPAEKGALTFPREFKPLMSGSPMAQPFIDYLKQRGYRDSEIEWLAKTYDLRYATIGDFAWRLIIPVCDRAGHLMTWTGRAISKNAEPRYKTLSVSSGPALLSTSKTLLGLPVLWAAWDPRALIICEGPFDALRLMVSGYSLGIYATCLFGLQVSSDQRACLQELEERFDRFYLMVDAPAKMQRLRLGEQLHPLVVRPLEVPSGVKDPGELSGAAAVGLCLDLMG
jgi:hypothetical protein